MSRKKRTFLGILAFYPIIAIIIDFLLRSIIPDEYIFVTIIIFYPVPILVMLDIILFIVLINDNKNLKSSKKTVWIILTIFFNIIMFPIYWYKFIKDKEETKST